MRDFMRTLGIATVMLTLPWACGCKSQDPAPPVRNDMTMESGVKSYDRLMIDPVEVTFDPASAHIQADPKEVKMLRDYMREAVVKAVKDRYKVVERPGTGVMRLRVTLTDVRKGEPLMHLHWSTKLLGLGLGGATMQSTLTDSVTDADLGTAFVSQKGNFFQLTEGLSKWGEAKAVMDAWAKEFRKKLDESRPKA
jgi:hypothetical protein